MDVAQDPEALNELNELGLKVIPVTTITLSPGTKSFGDKVIIGFDRSSLSEALNLGEVTISDSDAEWMLNKFMTVLPAARRATLQIPNDSLDWVSPERDRTLRQFTFHLFDRPNMMISAYEQGEYKSQDRQRYITDALTKQDVQSIVEFGESVIERIKSFFDNIQLPVLKEPVKTYMGTMPLNQLMDLGLGHSVHHLKQLYYYMGKLKIQPDNPLTEKDFDGISVPSELF
jgi:hypothetical protein|tara:strand:- start:310 stop:999 length:690 start_codon:yes stop_codon:yes gene_type:complete